VGTADTGADLRKKARRVTSNEVPTEKTMIFGQLCHSQRRRFREQRNSRELCDCMGARYNIFYSLREHGNQLCRISSARYIEARYG